MKGCNAYLLALILISNHFVIYEVYSLPDLPKFLGPCQDLVYFVTTDRKRELKYRLFWSDESSEPTHIKLFKNGQQKNYSYSRERNQTVKGSEYYDFAFEITNGPTKNGTIFQFKTIYKNQTLVKNSTVYLYNKKSDVPLTDRNSSKSSSEEIYCEIGQQNKTEDEDRNTLQLLDVLVGSSIAICIVAIATYMFIRMKKPKLSSEDRRKFFYGDNEPETEQTPQGDPFCQQMSVMVAKYTKAPYQQDYDIPMKNIKIANFFRFRVTSKFAVKFTTKEVLGEGHFGVVYKGKQTVGNTFREVACKTVKANLGKIKDFPRKFELFLREIKILQGLGKHDNIVSYIGSVTENIDNCDAYLVIEYCSKGNLLSYLKTNQGKFRSGIQGTQCQYSNPEDIEYGGVYTYNQLVQWAIDIASGMVFLSSKSVIHCDLAARNILLSSETHGKITAKISDFGLSKHAVKDKKNPDTDFYYKIWEIDPMAPLWIAPEFGLTEGQEGPIKIYESFDVWAFGVTMWEIFSLGEIPYISRERLNARQRLARPSCASTKGYSIMNLCWSIVPNERPKFTELQKMLLDYSTKNHAI